MSTDEKAHSVEESIALGIKSREEKTDLEFSPRAWKMLVERLIRVEEQIKQIQGNPKETKG